MNWFSAQGDKLKLEESPLQKAVIAGGNHRLYFQLMGAGAVVGSSQLEGRVLHPQGKILSLKSPGVLENRGQCLEVPQASTDCQG